MFFLLRSALIVGFIFYFSPVRQKDETPRHLPNSIAQAEAAWRDLSAEARKVVLEELRAGAAASLNDAATRLTGSRPEATQRP